jgi:hypothetical protein
MKKKAKPAVKKPVKNAKAPVSKRTAKPARGKQSAARVAMEEAEGALVGLAELIAISNDMRGLLAEIRDLLLAEAAAAEAEEQAAEEGGTMVITERESEGEDFE